MFMYHIVAIIIISLLHKFLQHSHIPQLTILWQNCAQVCTFLLQNGALWDICLISFEICEAGLMERMHMIYSPIYFRFVCFFNGYSTTVYTYGTSKTCRYGILRKAIHGHISWDMCLMISSCRYLALLFRYFSVESKLSNVCRMGIIYAHGSDKVGGTNLISFFPLFLMFFETTNNIDCL